MSFNIGPFRHSSDHASSIRLVYRTFQALGFYPLDAPSARSCTTRLAHSFILWVNLSLYGFILGTHYLSTVLRARSYLPEFFQCYMEDGFLAGVLFAVGVYCWRQPNIASRIRFIETSFCTTDQRIMATVHRKALVNYFMFVGILVIGLFGFVVEGFSLQVYMFFVFIFCYVASVSFVPIAVIHIQGQFQILCKHLEMVGHPHKNSEGKNIFYTNFETNQYVLVSDVLREGNSDYWGRSEPTNAHNANENQQHLAVPKSNNDLAPLPCETSDSGTRKTCWITKPNELPVWRSDEHREMTTIHEEEPPENAQTGYDDRSGGDLPRSGTSLSSSSPNTPGKAHQSTPSLVELEENYLKLVQVYEQDYFKQLVKFHQKLLDFIEQIRKDISELVLVMVVGNYLVASLALYQLTVQSETTSQRSP
ncbi:hypothetical protein WDU94_003376 [Cyamophila willieti]